MHISYCASAQIKTSPSQVAMDDDHYEGKWGICMEEKTPPAEVACCQEHLGHKYTSSGL